MEAGIKDGISPSAIREYFDIGEADIRTYSPLTLAYLGDGVFDVIIRTMVVAKGNMPTVKQHEVCASIVCATSQARLLTAIEGALTEKEADVVRRGRNAKPKNTAKNATRTEYLMATAFETLVGYLYLDGQMERLYELIALGLEGTASLE